MKKGSQDLWRLEPPMTHGRHLGIGIALAMLLFVSLHSYAQTDSSGSLSRSEEQNAARLKAEKDFNESRWSDAFREFKALHEELPDNTTITEFSC